MVSGKVERTVLSVAVLLFSVLVNGQTVKNHLYRFGEKYDSPSVVSTPRGITINYCLPELYIQSVNNSEGDFYRLSASGHYLSSEPGKPELPVFSRLIVIPENTSIAIRVCNVRSQKIKPSREAIKGLLYPKQVDETKSQDKQKTGFSFDKSLYGKRGIIESDTVRVEYIGKVRNKQLAAVYISPLRYNPFTNELEAITSMKIEVTFPDATTKSLSSGFTESALFSESLSKGTLNYTSSDVITGYSDKPVRMIILTDTAFKKFLKPYIAWKTRKGIRITTLYRGASLAGNTFSQIKDTLTKIYKSATEDNPAPEYLLIVGDVSRIPLSEGTTQVSDLYYGEFDGNNDYLPDMLIGRLPVSDTNEVKTVVDKIVKYESFQFADSNKFYRRALVTAGNDAGYANYMNGQVKYAVSNYLNSANNIEAHSFYYPQSAAADDSIKKLINNGVAFINYSGHGDASGWLDPVLKVPDVALLKNKNMYPFVITNACQTAHFNVAASLGNKMIVSADKGAVGYIGCSNDSYWDEDFYWSVGVGTPGADPKYSETGLGAYDRLFHRNNEKPSDWYVTMGQVNYAGNLSVSASTSTKKKYYWETYTLLGDPSIIPCIGKPDTIKIALPDTIPNGIKSLSLTIDPFTYIAISHRDSLWDASYASPSGSVVLDMPGISNDSCLVVITGQNKIPLVKKICIGSIKKEYINLSATGINDAESNNNGLADYSESLYLKTTISNLGLADASSLYGKLTTSSSWVSILKDSVYIGSLAGRSEIVLTNQFAIKIADIIPDKGYITLNLKLKDSKVEKNYKIDICEHAPVLEILNCIIDDSANGNGNLMAEPGETVNLVFSVRNTGSSNISGLFKIINNPPGVTINQPSVSTGSIEYGKTKSITVSITLSPLLLKGSTFDIISMLDCVQYIVNKTFSIPVGKIRESFEYQSFKLFPWQNSATYPWIITDGQAFEGQFSARSGIISNSSESALKIYINVPANDTVKFMYRVSSEQNYDFMYFKLNNVQSLKVSGETGWIEKRVALKEGFNLLEWTYKKDESISAGSDCAWIDFITFPAAGYNRIDLKTGKIVTPQPNKSYAQETITAQIINFGSDTIKSFNLAYTVNQNPAVFQNFVKKINPADTAVVAFTTPANLVGSGAYFISVFGFNNNDSYLKNDTASITVVNTAITSVENPDNLIKVMPNPFHQTLRIEINSTGYEEIRLSIFDIAGRIMWEEEFVITPGENTLSINPEYLAHGLYTLRIIGKTIYKVERIIKN